MTAVVWAYCGAVGAVVWEACGAVVVDGESGSWSLRFFASVGCWSVFEDQVEDREVLLQEPFVLDIGRGDYGVP